VERAAPAAGEDAGESATERAAAAANFLDVVRKIKLREKKKNKN
jgi:hypothetical protein